MKNDLKSIEDIKTIRKIMEESSRFLSLSGISGVLAGVIAIAGALVTYLAILDNGNIPFADYLNTLSEQKSVLQKWQLIGVAATVLLLSLLFAFYLSIKKAKRDNKTVWTPVSKRLLINMFIPLAAGGIFIIMLMIQSYFLLIIPCFLIFYGLALVNAGKFTFGEIFYLGILEIIIGLFAAFIPAQGLLFWIIGFGILHIIYGLVMYRKYGA
ncbi:MAG: hypothetical protein RBT49_10160 [Bacteroidales bacterium]|jgi:predicted lysophospholipase L1 biosynthesis ABC-type transport system permease subunit|nr:hypothetical protein [Bacteroidales bacterium]